MQTKRSAAYSSPDIHHDDMPPPGPSDTSETIIQPVSGWQLVDWVDLWRYRDMLYLVAWRDIKAQYAQSALGVGWAVIKPIVTMLVFTVIFGNLARISSDGVPYAIFSYTAIVPWAYFSSALTVCSNSLILGRSMIDKVYFPRMILPLSGLVSKLLDFAIALVLMGVLLLWYQQVPTMGVLLLPFLVLLMMLTALGLGMGLAALAVQYRDISYSLGFVVQLLMYLSPVVYPASIVPDQFRLLYGLNPMAGVIEGFRSALLGTNPMPWDLLAMGTPVALLLALGGMFYFRRMEQIFADVA